MDRTELKAEADRDIVDAIPLRAASTMLGSVRFLLRSAATTAMFERSEIAGNYATRGDEVVKRAHMAHTKRGSFIIPILVPLPDVSDIESPQAPIEGIEYQALPEPFERRVTRTFAQSLNALQETVIEPARNPTPEILYELVGRGVSREFCSHLGKILKEPNIGGLKASFEWASGVSTSVSIPREVSIDAGAVNLIEITAERLKRSKVDLSQTFSGNIVALRHSPKDPVGEVAVATIRRGRPCEIWITLPLRDYDDAISWHREGRIILAEGVVRRGPDRRLEVSELRRLTPIEDMYIPGVTAS
ncbi:hypothetical protein [Streptosporangium sp. NPDC050280]|uniref:hypothetical protein n=1 Tax=unclassified Streptosporangium TaxID=2632669 RepID=UPI0034227634